MNSKRALILSAGMVFILACSITFGNTPVPATPTVSPSPTSTPPPEVVETAAPPMVYTVAATPCWAGPGEAYGLVSDLPADQTFALTGRGDAYWIILLADGNECWVDASVVTVEGDASVVAERVPPPPPEPAAPAAPAGLQMTNRKCTPFKDNKGVLRYEIEFTLTWQDMSDNEAGFYVYRDNDKVGELPPNATQMVDTFTIRSGGKVFVYYVVAYNDLGQSQSEMLSLANPCFN